MLPEALDSYRDLAGPDHCGLSWGVPGGAAHDLTPRGEVLEKFAHLVKLAIGRLGAQFSPYLDEGLLTGRGLMALMAAAERAHPGAAEFPEAATRQIIRELRRWARATEWFARAWSRRVRPLCAAVARHGPGDEEGVACELGLGTGQLHGRFVEAGLVFGVSPDRMIPGPELSASARAAVAAAVAALPDPLCTLLTLYFRERLSFPEIAQLLDQPPDQVQAHYGRCAAAIRAAVVGSLAGE